MTADADWIDRFAGLAVLPADIMADLIAGSSSWRCRRTPVCAPGQSASKMLLQGSVRVQQKSDTGREVFLDLVHAGESCVLTTACMLAFEDYSLSPQPVRQTAAQ